MLLNHHASRYGDITPKTILGRLFTVIWTLVGVVLTALIVGQITNSLTTRTVQTPESVKSNSAKEKVI